MTSCEIDYLKVTFIYIYIYRERERERVKTIFSQSIW